MGKKDKIKILQWCNRHCCSCEEECGNDIIIHHIVPKSKGGTDDIDNLIPLCFKCHSKLTKYNKDHPLGVNYTEKEIKDRREQIYEKYTRHLIPTIGFTYSQQFREFPEVGTLITNHSNFPARFYVVAETILEGKNLGAFGTPYYDGKIPLEFPPAPYTLIGGYYIQGEAANSNKHLEIKVTITIIDELERKHKLNCGSFRYIRDKNLWNLEPKI